MKLGEVVELSFRRAVDDLTGKPVSAATAYKLSELLEKVDGENKKFQDLRVKLLKKYGKKDENGNLEKNEQGTAYLLEDEEAFDKEYKALIDIEVELPKISFDDIKDLKISTKTMVQLKPLLIT